MPLTDRRLKAKPPRMRFLRWLIPLLICAPLSLLAEPPVKPETVSWEVQDTQNQPFKIPANQPSVLVFAIPDQEATAKGLKEVNELLNRAKDFQILLIVSGEPAALKAAEVRGNLGWRMQIDTDYSSSAKFHVSVWPSFVVVKADGEIAGHVASLSAQMTRNLELYMDYARGKMDRATLEKAVHSSQVVEDTPASIAHRAAAMAEELLEKGMTDEAIAEISKAREKSPQDSQVQFVYARTLLIQNKPDDVLKIVEQIKSDFPAFQTAELKGEALVLLGRWEDATKELQQAVSLNPHPADALYALGICYQHGGDFQKASDTFRQAYEKTPAGKRLMQWFAPPK